MSGARGAWIERLTEEQDNLRAALAWCRHAAEQPDREIGPRLAGALFWFWVFRGEVNEGRAALEAALAVDGSASPAARATALHACGELAWLSGQYAAARTRLEESAALFRGLGDQRGLAYTLQALPLVMDTPDARETAAESLRLFEEIGDAWGAAHATFTMGYLALMSGDGDTARAALEDALARWRTMGDEWGSAQVLNYLGDIARAQGDLVLAAARYEESLSLLRKQEMPGTVPSLLHNLGHVALRRGDRRRALRLFRESLTLFRNQGDQRGTAECFAGVGGVFGALGLPDRATRLLGAAEALREAIGAAEWPANAEDAARNLAAVRAQMDEPAFAAAWAAGRALSLEEACDLALEQRIADLSDCSA
jgi:non-specific serine/threonine protein kinase